MARALVLEPTFVVMDEPTSALDMLIQSQIVDLLRELQKRRDLTYLFISHDLRVVSALASRLIVMRHGKVVEEGAAAELFRHPQSDYTRAPSSPRWRLQPGDRSGRCGEPVSKGALALLITGGTENWAPPRWRERFHRVCPDRAVALVPDDPIDPASVRYAAVWKPKPGALSLYPNLEVIFNLGAGVDAVLADKTLPAVPLVRVAVGDLTQRMTEYVVMHVLMHHRRQPYYTESQKG